MGMADQPVDKKVLGDKALELVMRDVLYGMEDLAARFGYDVSPYRVEILAIEQPAPTDAGTDAAPAQACNLAPSPARNNVVIPFPQRPDEVRLATQRKKIS